MQQKLAVASVLVLGLLALTSAAMIESHVFGQSPSSTTQISSSHGQTSTTSASTTTTSGGSLLTGANHTQTYSDDGNDTEHETEMEYGNSTIDT